MRWQRGQGKTSAFGNRIAHEFSAAGKILGMKILHVCATPSS